MNWAWEHRSLLVDLTTEHMFLAFIPVLIGFALALPLGVLVHRTPGFHGPMRTLTWAFATIPSISLFVFLPGVLSTRIGDRMNVVVSLTVFTAAVLTRGVLEGLASVPPHVRQTADAIGYGRRGLLTRVELPLATPSVFAALRVAAVSCVSLVSMGAVIGLGGLGQLFTDGFLRNFETEIIVGAVLTVLLSVGIDQLLVRIQRVVAPWARLVPIR
jgi:osmoprotectant transport system permease protein